MKSTSISRSLLLCAASIVLLCQSAHAACKSSGQINLPIVGRPTAPAVITWSPALTAAANAAVQAKRLPTDNSPINTGTWIGVNFADHHILPQTSLQALVKITEAADSDICHTSDWSSILSSLNAIKAPGNAPLLTAVVWAPVNLFEGPTRALRADDPGSGSETNKPASFDATRWNLLQAVDTKLNAVGQFNGSYFVIDAKKLNGQGIRDLAAALAALAAQVKGANPAITVHPFQASDWVSSSNPRQVINLNDLLGYNNNQLVYTALLQNGQKYQLKPR